MTAAFFDGDFVVSRRSGIIENRHLIHAAVVDGATGMLLYMLGDPQRMTLIRSAAKPVQAIPVVEAGGLELFGFDESDLALFCGSHNSEDYQLQHVKKLLHKAQLQENDLQCGGHPSIHSPVNNRWIQQGFTPTAICSNCSGNHIGVMAGAKAIGETVDRYEALDHPIQVAIKRVMGELTGLPADDIKWGLDGCNMYGPATPLQSIALIYATFAQAADQAGKDASPDSVSDDESPLSTRTKTLARIYNAMVHNPHLIGGSNRFCTVLLEAYQGSLFGKAGADGCYAIGVRESEATRRLGAKGAIGIVLKVEDGNHDVMYGTAAELLEQLQIGTDKMRVQLDRFHRGEIKNTKGTITGELSYPFKLRKA